METGAVSFTRAWTPSGQSMRKWSNRTNVLVSSSSPSNPGPGLPASLAPTLLPGWPLWCAAGSPGEQREGWAPVGGTSPQQTGSLQVARGLRPAPQCTSGQ